MNVMNNSSGDEEQVECPLCMEPLEVDDLHFYPCTCGYQICRFCWHRIRTDENELCPACRKAYPENPADFTPLSQEQIAAFKAEKRQRDQQRKAKISENRKHLANVRVVQKNLVFVVGLPPRLADPEILKKHEYFGKYGKIHKVVINPSSTYAGVPSASAYVTYINNNDALKAIQSVNNINMDGRLIKTSLGTTKYCSHFMKNQTCPKPDCMYLHELGDQEASFTKEEMHQGKHQEYEKRLHDTMQAQLGLTVVNGVSSGGTLMNGSNVGGNNSTSGGVGNGNGNGGNGTGTGTTTNGILANGTNGSGKTGDSKHISDITNGPIQSKEAWPSLSTTPIDGSTHGNGGGGSNKENKINGKTVGSNKENGSRKHEKSRTKGGRKHRGTRDSDRNRERDRELHSKDNGGKDSHSKRNSSSSSSSNNRSSSSSNHVKDSTISSGANNVTNGGIGSSRKNANAATASSAFGATNAVSTTVISNGNGKPVTTEVNGHLTGDEGSGKEVQDNGKDIKQIALGSGNSNSITTSNKSASHLDDLDDDDDELDFEDLDNDALSSDNDGKTDTPSLSSSGSSRAGGDSGSILSETPSGKSSPTAFPDPVSVVNNVISTGNTTTAIVTSQDETVLGSGAIVSTATTAITNGINSSSSSISSSNFSSSSTFASASDDKSASDSTELVIEPSSPASLFGGNDDIGVTTAMTVATSTASKQHLQQQQQQQSQPQNGMNKMNSLIDSSISRFAKLSVFDDNSSFFSHSTFDPYSNYNKLEGVNGHLDGIQPSGLTSSQLPDLLSGTNDSNEQHTKEILKNLSNIQQQQQQHHLFNNVHLQQQLNGLGLGNGGIESGTSDDWEFSKYVMRNKLDVDHHEELLRLQELQKRNTINNGLSGPSQFNGFNGDYADYFHNTNELNSRLLSQQQQHAHQRLQQQQPQHTDMTHIYAGNMSKFFDFHKNQQQQAAQHQQMQQQNQPFLLNGHSSLAAPDAMNITGLLEHSRLSSHFLEQHSNGLLGSQHVQKQRMLNGHLNAHSILLNGSNPQQQSQMPQQQPNNRLHNPQQQSFSQQQNTVADDDLGFDPFIETQKALAELINDDVSQPQMPQSAATTAPNHSKLLENVQRTRMPPPGFNHMNAFGFGVPRPHVSSKILPFMNLANNSQQQQQQQPQQPSWGQQLQQQQQQFMGFQQNDQNHLAQSQPPSGNNKAGYGNNLSDWTSFDPAIVSLRQFSFMNGSNQPGDLFLSAQQPPNQQGMQQPGQAFGHHGINMQSNLINQQQQQSTNPQAQVKYDDFFLHHHQLQHQQQQHQQQLQQQPQQQSQQAHSNMNDYFTKLSYRMLSS